MDILLDEKEVAARIEDLATVDAQAALEYCRALAQTYGTVEQRAQSAACARCLCRFLLHRKTKSRLPALLREDALIRRIVFGTVNTYKYSLVRMLRIVMRENDPALLTQVLTLLKNNPFADENAKPYTDRWSAAFIVREALTAPADYLKLSEDCLTIIRQFLGEVMNNEKDPS